MPEDFDANRLHPDGAPGVLDTYMRSVLGDAGYERWVAQQERKAETEAQKAQSDALAVSSRSAFLNIAALSILLLSVSASVALLVEAFK